MFVSPVIAICHEIRKQPDFLAMVAEATQLPLQIQDT